MRLTRRPRTGDPAAFDTSPTLTTSAGMGLEQEGEREKIKLKSNR